jgi:putative redox protein
MKNDSLSLNWISGMNFETEINGHKLSIDANQEFGGDNKGPRPKPLMMLALAGCTGMDVISILHKMRIVPDSFEVKIESALTEEHPKQYSEMKVVYLLTGSNLPPEKVIRAVDLSKNQYCGVSAFYSKAIPLEFEIIINGVKIA